MKIDIPKHSIDELYKLDPDKSVFSFQSSGLAFSLRGFKSSTRQFGELLVVIEPDSSGKNVASTVTIRDVRANKELWHRRVEHEVPSIYYSKPGSTLTLVIADYDDIKEEAKGDPSLSSRLNAIEGRKGKRDSYVVRAFDAVSGKNLGAVLVDTGNLSFKVRWANTIGDTVVVGDSKDRTLVYSLKTGEQKGKIPGQTKAASKTGDRILVDTGKGSADLYDLASLQPVTHFAFPTRIVRAEFADDGNSIFVLTADQNVYNLKNPK